MDLSRFEGSHFSLDLKKSMEALEKDEKRVFQKLEKVYQLPFLKKGKENMKVS